LERDGKGIRGGEPCEKGGSPAVQAMKGKKKKTVRGKIKDKGNHDYLCAFEIFMETWIGEVK